MKSKNNVWFFLVHLFSYISSPLIFRYLCYLKLVWSGASSALPDSITGTIRPHMYSGYATILF